jgi:hypothetical protein
MLSKETRCSKTIKEKKDHFFFSGFQNLLLFKTKTKKKHILFFRKTIFLRLSLFVVVCLYKTRKEKKNERFSQNGFFFSLEKR